MKKLKPLLAAFSVVFFMLISVSVSAQKDTSVISLNYPLKSVLEQGPVIKVSKDKSVTGNSSVSGNVLYKTPVPNLTNTLYGYLPGLFVKQGSGEPG